MLAELSLPHREHETLNDPPLKIMLGQVRFDPILQIDRQDFIAPFQEDLRSEYPQFGPQQEFSLVASPEGVLRSEASKSWRFGTADGAWAVILAPSFVTLEADAPQYLGYETFRRRFQRVWEATLNHIGPSRAVQQGLRYINHIEGSLRPQDWRRYISPALLGPLGEKVFGEEIFQCVSDLKLKRPDGQLSVKYGLTPHTGPNQASGFLLDFDYFTQEQTTDLAAEVVLSRFDTFHEIVFDLFCWCLNGEYLSSLQGDGEEKETFSD